MSSLFSPGSGSGGLQFRLFGVPVSISLSIVLLLAFLGFQLGDPVRIVLWVAIGIGAILLHELGHALVARAAGAKPSISLAGLGGVTQYRASETTHRRGWSLAIGLAGPAVGIVLGLAAIGLGAPCCGVVVGGTTSAFAASVFVFVSLGWSVLNLLPILPLDGGQALAQLLPGSREDRYVCASVVGTVIGGAVTAYALVAQYPFGAILGGLLTWQNIRIWWSRRQADQLGGLIEQGELQAARDRLHAGHGSPEDAAKIQQQAYETGEFQIAAEAGEIALERGFLHPAFAYVTARAWAQLGAHDRAIRSLQRAIELGFDDRETLRRDPALGALREHPEWPAVAGG